MIVDIERGQESLLSGHLGGYNWKATWQFQIGANPIREAVVNRSPARFNHTNQWPLE